ncbi:MAG TPA: L-threonylcarbamoyladenylate synthase [Candidatus Saccharimonadia bacterium]
MIRHLTLEQAAEALKVGQVGVIPTDTIYGLVARAADPQAVAKLYALKHRERKPGTVIAANVEQLVELGVPEDKLRRVAHLWPGALSVVVPTGDRLDYLHQGLVSLAIRVPGEPRVRALLEQAGPLVTSSANQPGEPVAANVEEAKAYFDELVDFYVDGGTLGGRLPSTIIRVNNGAIEVLREGAVKIS